MRFLFYFIFGYFICTLGFLTGGFLSVFVKGLGKKNEGVLFAFTAGLFLAFVCFELLPQAFAQSFYLGIAALVAGTLASIAMESTGSVLAVGLALHKLPEGFALGALLGANLTAGLSLAAVIAIHCIPEAITLALLLKHRGMKYGKIVACLLAMGFPMAIGTEAGAAAGRISPWLMTVSLGFAGGIMIYLSCSQILPEARSVGGSLSAAAGAMSGFIAGTLIISLL